MKKRAFTAALAAIISASVQADTVGLYLGGQIWQSSTDGTLGERNTLVDFDLKKERQVNYFIAAEHPLPFLPNARVSSTALNTTGKATLTKAFSFNSGNFAIGDTLNANFNVSYIDYTLYYELFDNSKFSFDLGFSARDFNGDVAITGPTVTIGDCHESEPDNPCTLPTSSFTPVAKIKTNDIEPMLYLASDISLPFTGLSLIGQGDFSLKGDHSLYDYQVGLSYDLINSMMIDLNVTLGYRVIKMEFEDLNNLYSDLEFKGAFVGVIAHF